MAEPKVSIVLDLLDRTTTPLNGIKSGFSSLAKGIGAAFAGLAIGKVLKDAVDEAVEAERGIGRLKTAVENAGGSFKGFAPQAEAAVAAVQRLSTATDDDLRDALTRMITISGDSEGSLKNLQLAADLAAFSGKDLGESADIVGKVMAGNTKPLKEFGISAGSVSEGMEQLRQKVGGFAEQEAQTFGGTLQRLKNGWDDMLESLGNAIIGNDDLRASAGGLIGVLANVAAWIEENEAVIGAWVSAIVTVASAIGTILGEAIKFVMPLILRLLEIIGMGIEGLGSLLTVGQNLLRKFGIDVGTKLSMTLKDAGAKIQQTARDAYMGVHKTAEAGEQGLTGVVQRGGSDRHKLTKEELAERQRLQKEANEQLIALARLQTDATIKLIEQANRAQLEYLKRFPQLKKEAKTAAEEAGDALERALTKVNAAWAVFERRAEAVTDETTDHLSDLVSTVSGVARGLLDAASAAGIFGASLSSGLNSVINLGEAIGKISKGDLLGGVTQGVGALVNLGKTIFGSSDHLKQAINANVKKLEDVRRRMGDLVDVMLPGNQLTSVQRALREVLPKLSGQLGSGEKRALDAALLRQGMTRQQLNDVAEALGIQIRDSKGNLETDLLKQLFEAIGLADTGFAETFGGQLDRINQGLSIGSITDEMAALMELISDDKIGIPAIAGALAGLDLSTEAGRAAGATALRDLFTNIDRVGAAGLGGANRTQFIETLSHLIELFGAAPSAPATAGVAPIDPAVVAATGGTPAAAGALGVTAFAGIEANTAKTNEYLAAILELIGGHIKGLAAGDRDAVLTELDLMLQERYSTARTTLGLTVAA